MLRHRRQGDVGQDPSIVHDSYVATNWQRSLIHGNEPASKRHSSNAMAVDGGTPQINRRRRDGSTRLVSGTA